MSPLKLKESIQNYLEIEIPSINWKNQNINQKCWVNIYNADCESDRIVGKRPKTTYTISISIECRGSIMDDLDDVSLILIDQIIKALFKLKTEKTEFILSNPIKNIRFTGWKKSISTESISDTQSNFLSISDIIYEFTDHEY